jgi:hypothetical protein
MPNPKSMASGDLTITLIRVRSFRAGRHGDNYAQTSQVLYHSGRAVVALRSQPRAGGLKMALTGALRLLLAAVTSP